MEGPDREIALALSLIGGLALVIAALIIIKGALS